MLYRYVERVSDMLRQKMKQADILVLKGTTMIEKRQEALEEQARLEPRIDLLAGCTRELQKLVKNYYLNIFMVMYKQLPVKFMLFNIEEMHFYKF